jgi:ABC-type bacteriocin/lantibiotic exporter with double-glycine peptidase domain
VPGKPYIAAPYYPPAPHGDASVRVRPIRAYFQVRNFTCGFASTLTVLHAFQRAVQPRDLYERLGTDWEGTSQSAILRELRRAELSVNVRYDLDLPAIQRAIDKGKLIIGYHHRVEHWVVIYGYGKDPDRLFVADPVREWRREHRWDEYGPKLQGFGIVCSGKRRKRQSAAPTLSPQANQVPHEVPVIRDSF